MTPATCDRWIDLCVTGRMTKRATDVIGKPVVTANGGQRLGTVADLLLDDSSASVVGLVIRSGMLKGESVLPVSAVQTLGKDAVVSRSNELISARTWRQQHNGQPDEPLPDPRRPDTVD